MTDLPLTEEEKEMKKYRVNFKAWSTVSIKMRVYNPAKEYMEKHTDFDCMSEFVLFLLEREMAKEGYVRRK